MVFKPFAERIKMIFFLKLALMPTRGEGAKNQYRPCGCAGGVPRHSAQIRHRMKSSVKVAATIN